MHFSLIALLLVTGLFAGMLLLLELAAESGFGEWPRIQREHM